MKTEGHDFFKNFMVSFRSALGGLNAGVLSLYEIFSLDSNPEMQDFNMFLLFLEVYGSGKNVAENGSFTPLEELRRNSPLRVEEILVHLKKLNENAGNPNLGSNSLEAKL